MDVETAEMRANLKEITLKMQALMEILEKEGVIARDDVETAFKRLFEK